MDDRRREATTVATLLLALGLAGCATGGGFRVESGPAGADRTLEEGTEIRAELEDRLGVEESEEGDQFHLTVDEAVEKGGTTLIPAGGLVHGRVTAVHRSEGSDDPNVLKVQLYRIDVRGESYDLDAELSEVNPETDTGETLAKVGGGALAGAVLGTLIGDDEAATVAGAAIGAAAGTAIAMGTRDDEAVLARGSKVTMRLTEPLELR